MFVIPQAAADGLQEFRMNMEILVKTPNLESGSTWKYTHPHGIIGQFL